MWIGEVDGGRGCGRWVGEVDVEVEGWCGSEGGCGNRGVGWGCVWGRWMDGEGGAASFHSEVTQTYTYGCRMNPRH